LWKKIVLFAGKVLSLKEITIVKNAANQYARIAAICNMDCAMTTARILCLFNDDNKKVKHTSIGKY